MTTTNYYAEAKSDAQSCAEYFRDEIVEQYIEKGEASDDLNNDYPRGDSYHHESHVDHSYNLTEAAAILDELSEYEETDEGLWQGLEPRRAIEAQAAYTYGNAVYDQWRRLVEEINDDDDLSGVRDELESLDDDEELTDEEKDAKKAELTKRIGEIIDELIKAYA